MTPAGLGSSTEGCQSGRMGRSRKPLYVLRTVGSNPTLSARVPVAPGVHVGRWGRTELSGQVGAT